MCLGAIHVLEDVWEDAGARVGRLDDDGVVTLAYVPDAQPGAYVLVHLGIPVEILRAEDAEAALGLRAAGRA
jgi:hydrogenase expression/formation protein HypC